MSAITRPIFEWLRWQCRWRSDAVIATLLNLVVRHLPAMAMESLFAMLIDAVLSRTDTNTLEIKRSLYSAFNAIHRVLHPDIYAGK